MIVKSAKAAVILAFLCATFPSAPARAHDALRFDLPIQCTFGATCMVQNMFDLDPGPGVRDYACGTLSYDGHDGVDFRVPDLPTMLDGIPVVAAAAGVVSEVRDGVQDIDLREGSPIAIMGREAGNVVVIDHGGGWHSVYAHLRRRSIVVRPGHEVVAGQKLGLVGMSGRATFPHVHFEVKHDGRPVDPFVGSGASEGCEPRAGALWTRDALQELRYTPSGALAAGFATVEPDWIAARRGDYGADVLRADVPGLFFWVGLFGAREGDRESLIVFAPDGGVIARSTRKVGGNRALLFSFGGGTLRGDAWPTGTYRGEYRLLRKRDDVWRAVVSAVREIELY